MFSVSIQDVMLTMSACFFLLGMITFTMGVYILVWRATGRDFRTMTHQATKLAQKGLAEDIAGLVGNVNVLISTMSDMVKTATGVGVFLSLSGVVLMAAGFYVLLQIHA